MSCENVSTPQFEQLTGFDMKRGGRLTLFEFESGNLFLDVCVCLHVLMCIVCVHCLWRPEESSGFPWN